MGYRERTAAECEAFAGRMRRFRKRHKLTQKQLAAAMGMGVKVITLLENCEERPWEATVLRFRAVEAKYERAKELEMAGLEGLS
jgi:transcriptional regulator with XRE-family HTH domain